MKALAKFIATGFGIGYVPLAPGTAGSLLGVGYWLLLSGWFYWPVTILVVLLAVWLSGIASEIHREADPSCVVIDEICAVPIALAGIGHVWWHVALGFVWFRVFDVWKPPPVRQAQAFAGGVGIVLDDVLAAGYACGTTHVVLWLIQHAGH
jgi:phosphatidylglycerophosphatase A